MTPKLLQALTQKTEVGGHKKSLLPFVFLLATRAMRHQLSPMGVFVLKMLCDIRSCI